MRYFVALDKGWPVLLTDAEPLPWSARIVSEHASGQDAADACDKLKAALAADEQRFGEWQRYIRAAYDETVRLFWSRKLFRAVSHMFQTNYDLMACGGHVRQWFSQMYLHDAAMLVRRELDKQAGVLNLLTLLHDIEQHHPAFARHSPGRDLPPVAAVRSDREVLVSGCQTVRDYAERSIAHRTGTPVALPTPKDTDRAVKLVLHTMRRYYGFLTATDLLQATPEAHFDWLAPFKIPWRPEGFSEPDDDEELPEAEKASAKSFPLFYK